MLKIVNLMLGKGLGGIEQAALDYAAALDELSHDVLMITDPDAEVNAKAALGCYGLTHLKQRSKWDILAAARLKKIITGFQADVVITHGNRALNLTHRAAAPDVPVVAVSHNYSIDYLPKADAVFCITEHMRQEVLKAYPARSANLVYTMPNMVKMHALQARPRWHSPVRIGAMGRLVHKKGFDTWLKALARLRDKGVSFEAWLGGDGDERAALEALSKSLGLEGIVTFKGWVKDTREFYQRIDIFCMPSHHEPFGIVVIEAMAHGLPVISSDSEGPMEIIGARDCGVLVEKANPSALAEALLQMLENEAAAHAMGQRAHEYVAGTYSMGKCGKRMSAALQDIVQFYDSKKSLTG